MNRLLYQISASTVLKNLSLKRSGNHHCSMKATLILGSFVLSRFGGVHCYSSKIRKPKSKAKAEIEMVEDKDAFFVVRKGDIVGVYNSLNQCQAQLSSSICDPPVSVFKGHSLPKDAVEYLSARGLQNALYTIKASDLNEDIFGSLVPCPFQEPSSTAEISSMDFPQKRPHDMLGSENMDAVGSTSASIVSLNKLLKLDNASDSRSCIIEFDATTKGNPGKAGAGVVLRTNNGNLICKIRGGLGIATYNVAEYGAVILGLKKALEMGYTSIQAQCDSELVCMQLQGLWKVKHPNLSDLHAEAKKLKERFCSFQISLVSRESNSEADTQAKLAAYLPDGRVEQDFCDAA